MLRYQDLDVLVRLVSFGENVYLMWRYGDDTKMNLMRKCENAMKMWRKSTNRLKPLYASRHGGPTISGKDKTARRPHSQLYNEYKWI